jgi:tetrahydromethanopterin S-methyltransferase subunit H
MMNNFWEFNIEQKVFDIGGVKVGGIPGARPTVLIGTIFYQKHDIMTDERRGEFDRHRAEDLVKTQEEFSDRTGNPCMLDVVGATPEAMITAIEFAAETSSCPLLIDGVSLQIRMEALRYVDEVGLSDRAVYNCLTPEYKPYELEALEQSDVSSAVFLAYQIRDFTSRGRLRTIRETIPQILEAGIEKLMVDTFVLDIPSLGSASKAVYDVKNQLGYPTGCGAHNAIGTWTGLKTKMGDQAKNPCTAVASALPVAVGGDFVFYGPIEGANYIFPAVALINAAYSQLSIEKGIRPDRSHPRFKIP